MKYKIYKMEFPAGVHLGGGSLAESEYIIHADTLFSALCIEVLKLEGEAGIKKLVQLVDAGNLKLSSCLPFDKENLYVPRPIMNTKVDREFDSAERKALKKIKFLPVNGIGEYLSGVFDYKKVNSDFSEFTVRTRVNIEVESTVPYSVGVCSFKKGCGLYVIIGSEEEESLFYIEELLDSLSYTGIGGKRTSGLGKFILKTAKIPSELEERLAFSKLGGHKMLLSMALPKNLEMEKALAKAQYILSKRSGYIYSSSFADRFLKKKDVYAIEEGSCFVNTFEGQVLDVSVEGTHPVYRYLVPMFMEVD